MGLIEQRERADGRSRRSEISKMHFDGIEHRDDQDRAAIVDDGSGCQEDTKFDRDTPSPSSRSTPLPRRCRSPSARLTHETTALRDDQQVEPRRDHHSADSSRYRQTATWRDGRAIIQQY
jgi:hypothetical protein